MVSQPERQNITCYHQEFIQTQIQEIKQTVGSGRAINAVSGGVDSSVVTVLAHRALGAQLTTIFVENALMREGEPQRVVATFAKLGVPVEVIEARGAFLGALKGLTYSYKIDINKIDLEYLKANLSREREFFLRLIENPALMEHESFTDLLLA